MKEDQFEDFIRNNREEFDLDQPSDQVWEKIRKSREAESPKVIKLWPRLRQIAAVFIIGLAFVGVYSLLKPAPGIVQEDDAFIPPEVAEMNLYYEQQVNLAMEELQQTEGVDADLTAEVSTELEYLEEEKLRLLEELKNDVNNEAILEELIRTYRMRLQVLEDVLEILREINQSEDKEHENVNTISL